MKFCATHNQLSRSWRRIHASKRQKMESTVIDLTQEDTLNRDFLSPVVEDKDVFETSDVETDEIHKDTHRDRDEAVDVSELTDYNDSRAVFETTILENKDSDFSGRVDRYDMACYKGRVVRESLPQRLARIRKELEEIKTMDPKNETVESDVQQLIELHAKMSERRKLELGKIRYALNAQKDDEIVNLPNIDLDYGPTGKFIELEQRISHLERYLGANTNEHVQKSATSMINDLYRQLNLLKSSKEILPEFEKRLKEVNENYENSIIGRRINKDVELQKKVSSEMKTAQSKIEEIYNSYGVLKKYTNVLPHVVTRLKTMNSIHLEVGDGIKVTQGIDESITNLQDSASKWKQLLQEVELKLQEHEERFEKNKNEVHKWVRNIDEKLTRLE